MQKNTHGALILLLALIMVPAGMAAAAPEASADTLETPANTLPTDTPAPASDLADTVSVETEVPAAPVLMMAEPGAEPGLVPQDTLAAPAELEALEALEAGPLTLEQSLHIARVNNLQYLNQYQNLLNSHAQLERARGPFGLQARASFDLPTYSEFRDVEENVALATRIVEDRTSFIYRGQVNLSQRLPNLGQLSVVTRAQRQDFSSNLRSDYLDVMGDMRATYSQELLHTPAEEIALKRAELGFTAARHQYDWQYLALEGQVTDAFYDLVQSIRQLEIEEQRLEQSRANLDLAQRQFEIGLIAEVQALRLRVTMLNSEANFAQAQTQIERRRDVLRQVLGLDLDAPLEVVTQVEMQEFAIDPQRALELGLQRRTDMQQAEINQQINRLNLADTRRRQGVTASMNASVSLLGRGESLDDISRNLGRNYWDVGLQVNMPVLDSGERRGQIRQAEIALEQSRLSQDIVRRNVVREIRDAVRNLEEAELQITLRQASLEVAERTYDVEQSRFELGLAQSQELLDAQAELTFNRIRALEAIIDYQRRLKDLRLATMATMDDLAPRATEDFSPGTIE